MQDDTVVFSMVGTQFSITNFAGLHHGTQKRCQKQLYIAPQIQQRQHALTPFPFSRWSTPKTSGHPDIGSIRTSNIPTLSMTAWFIWMRFSSDGHAWILLFVGSYFLQPTGHFLIKHFYVFSNARPLSQCTFYSFYTNDKHVNMNPSMSWSHTRSPSLKKQPVTCRQNIFATFEHPFCQRTVWPPATNHPLNYTAPHNHQHSSPWWVPICFYRSQKPNYNSVLFIVKF